ncbi:MAG: acyltransferase family protein [Pseudomonadota bacterium]
MRYRPEIDGLRAFAVLPVIWFHAGLPGLSGGFTGVDVFFVISGFLITRLILDDLERGTFSLVDFYERRARRILPALIVVVLACIPFAWVWMTPDQLEMFGRSLVSVATFTSNIDFWLRAGYFAPAAGGMPLIHTWSLAVEEQFYLLFPLLLMAIWAYGRRAFVAPLIGLAAMSFALMLLLSRLDHASAAFYLLPARGWELLAGAVAAVMVKRYGLVTLMPGAVAWAGLLMIIAGYLSTEESARWPGVRTLLPVLGTALLLVSMRPEGTVTRLFSMKLPVAIGLISYSAYLWHQPLFAFPRLTLLDPPSPWLMAVLTCATFLLAWLTFVLIERPVRDRAWLERPRVFTNGALGLAMVATLGLSGYSQDGYPDRFPQPFLGILKTAERSPMNQECHGPASRLPDPDEACIYFVDAEPRWAVFGDSHGVEIAFALAEKLAKRGESLVHLTASGCPAAFGYTTPVSRCGEWSERALTWLEHHPTIDHVVVAYRHGVYLYGENGKDVLSYQGERGARVLEGETDVERRALYWSGFEYVVDRLERSGVNVLVLAPVPELTRTVQRMLLSGARKITVDGDVEAISIEAIMARQRDLRERLELLSDRSRIIDPLKALCRQRACLGARAGKALYFDEDHLSITGARLVVAESGLAGISLPDSGHRLVSHPSQNKGNKLR